MASTFLLKVIRMTGFMKGLYTDVEMKSDNVKVGGRCSPRGLQKLCSGAGARGWWLRECLALSSPQLPPAAAWHAMTAFRNTASVPEVGASPSPNFYLVVVGIKRQEF